MEESNREGINIRILKESEPAERKTAVTAEMFANGEIWASQNWAREADKKKAIAFTRGLIGDYKRPDESEAFVFLTEDGRENILILNGHHRSAQGIVEEKPYEIAIRGGLGVLSPEILQNPQLAAQKLAVLGIEGIWPFRDFIRIYLDVRIDKNGNGNGNGSKAK